MGEVGSAGLRVVVGWYGLRGGDRGEIGVIVVVVGWGWVRRRKG